MSADPVPGRSLVTTRAIRDLVRSATLSVYGVSGFTGGGPVGRLFERIGLAHPGLHLESGVRYTLLHALGREPDRVTIRIGRLRREHGIAPTGADPASGDPRPSDLAASGTDVA